MTDSETALVPDRPSAVPSEARWLADEEVWQHGHCDAEGRKQGEQRSYRRDGTLWRVCTFRDDREEGSFEVFHSNGQLARRGCFVDGQLDGEVISLASDAETSERLRGCCVPEGAWEMRARYRSGELHGERFFDRLGRALLSDGSLRPDRPAGIPIAADYDDFSRRWSVAPADDQGEWLYFRQDGSLSERCAYRGGTKVRSRLFDSAGVERLWTQAAADGKSEGACFRIFGDANDIQIESPYADAAVKAEHGSFAAGQPVGCWELRDASVEVVSVLQRGRAFFSETLVTSEAFADIDASAEKWREVAVQMHADDRCREALIAAARAVGRGAAAVEFEQQRRLCAVALTSEEDARLCREVTEGKPGMMSSEDEGVVPRALTALVLGADPAVVLRILAAELPGRSRVARDLVEASVALAPERPMTYLTRGLLRIERGDPAGARADADRVAAESPDTAAFLRDYVDIVYPPLWSFWPTAEPVTGPSDNLPDEPQQPPEALVRVVRVYATRMALLCDAVRAALPEGPRPAWLPPEPTPLLPDGPVPLEQRMASIIDQTDDGPETTEVEINERLELPADVTVATLMRSLRSHHRALTFLVWAGGATGIGPFVPGAPPAEFAAATGMALTRYFRVRDVIETNGLRSMTQGIPGFVYEGYEIDELPAALVQVAVDEYFELRALFLWLICPENLSPFQSDLRAH